MCFDVTDRQRHRAKKDIICYKVMSTHNGLIGSPYYNRGVWEELEIRETSLDKKAFKSINSGFHSHQSKVFAKAWKYVHFEGDRNYKIFTFIIPKGSYYYQNDEQYVSNRIYLKSKKALVLKDIKLV